MSYDREARRAVSSLRGVDVKVFELIETAESVEMEAVPELVSNTGVAYRGV